MDTTDLLKTAELDFNEFENIIAENPNIITKTDSNERHLIHWYLLKGIFRYDVEQMKAQFDHSVSGVP